jgi:alanyl-tRNA synthetase
LRAFTAEVTAVRDAGGRPAVALSQTAFYPAAGGQPCDLGRLGAFPVTDVHERDDEIWHVLDGGPPPAAGDRLEGRIDWERRFDHMQQHSGQHILSQAFLRALDAQTLSVHMGTTCTIDVALPTLDAAGAAAVEALANTVARENRPVIIRDVDPERVAALGLRRPPKVSGPVRVVEIESFDRSACGGTHVRACAEVAPIIIRGWERYKGGTRVDFVCGDRALRDAHDRLALVRDLAGQFSVGETELRDAVARLRGRARELERELAEARARLVEQEAAGLVDAARRAAGAGQVAVVAAAFSGRPIEDLRALASAATARERCVAIFATDPDRRMIVARSPALPVDASAILREALSAHQGRGGGKSEAAEGRAAAAPSAAALVEAASAAARRHLAAGA